VPQADIRRCCFDSAANLISGNDPSVGIDVFTVSQANITPNEGY
jgi:hypothetical protein